MNTMKLGLVAGVISIAGCASGGRCVGEFEYQKAETVPAIRGTEGVKAPESGSALRVPPAPKQSTAFAETVDDPARPGKQKVQCLDTPPALPEAPPAPAAKPQS